MCHAGRQCARHHCIHPRPAGSRAPRGAVPSHHASRRPEREPALLVLSASALLTSRLCSFLQGSAFTQSALLFLLHFSHPPHLPQSAAWRHRPRCYRRPRRTRCPPQALRAGRPLPRAQAHATGARAWTLLACLRDRAPPRSRAFRLRAVCLRAVRSRAVRGSVRASSARVLVHARARRPMDTLVPGVPSVLPSAFRLYGYALAFALALVHVSSPAGLGDGVLPSGRGAARRPARDWPRSVVSA
jgi:hypothetical protein